MGIVLGCNNYKIIDLGVMVPCEKILQTARENHADIIGLSGLITPSLEEMVHVAREMQRLGMDVPLLIGGATTSPRHTAVKIAPAYSREVVHVKDASRCVPVCERLLSAEKRPQFDVENRAYQAEMVAAHQRKHDLKLVSYREAIEGRFQSDWAAIDIPVPSFLGVRTLADYPLEQLVPYIDWAQFFAAWEMRGKFPDILDHPQRGPEARKLYDDARRFLDQIIANRWLRAAGVYAFWPAAAERRRHHPLRRRHPRRGESPLASSSATMVDRVAAVLLLQCRFHRPAGKRTQGLHGRFRGHRRPGHR